MAWAPCALRHPWVGLRAKRKFLIRTARTIHPAIAADGTVKTIAVSPESPALLMPRRRARFSRPRGMALDPDGNLFVVDMRPDIRIGRPDPSLQATQTNGQVILSWPAWTTNYQLETSTVLPATNWSAVSAAPVVVGNRFVLTNSATEPRQFFRLLRP